MFLKKIVSLLPSTAQIELKRIHFRSQIKKGTFDPGEPEYDLLPEFVKEGDCVLDIGANVGHYTKPLSDLVGNDGRVFALEPVPETFSILASNTLLFKNSNVTLVNAAASDQFGFIGMDIPVFTTGLKNYYCAHLSNNKDVSYKVLTIPVDLLCIPNIKLVKIDAENHELQVLIGMKKMLSRSHPTLIIETDSEAVSSLLAEFGYEEKKLKGSPNIIYL